MLRELATRLLDCLIVLLATTFTIFVLSLLTKSDPATALLGMNASPTALAAKRHELELDRPLYIRYAHYLERLAHADLGQSTATGRSVATDIKEYLPASIELMAVPLLAGTLLGAAVALIPVLHPRLAAIRHLLTVVSSMPIFLTGLLLSAVFWYALDWLPGGGRITPDTSISGPTGLLLIDLSAHPALFSDALKHIILPAVTLALPLAVAIARTLHASVLSQLSRNYVRTARAKGLDDARILRRHVLRNAAGPTLSMFGLQFAFMFTNLMVVERIFSWPGIGSYLLQALVMSDTTAVLGVALVFATAYLLLTFAIEALQIVLEPRLRKA